MAQVKFPLVHGIKIGNKTEKNIVLTDPTVADLLECAEESERAVYTSEGAALVPSPTIMGALLLCRQIKSIGGAEVPVDIDLLKKFHPDDLLIMQLEAGKLDDAAKTALEALTNRGKS